MYILHVCVCVYTHTYTHMHAFIETRMVGNIFLESVMLHVTFYSFMCSFFYSTISTFHPDTDRKSKPHAVYKLETTRK